MSSGMEAQGVPTTLDVSSDFGQAVIPILEAAYPIGSIRQVEVVQASHGTTTTGLQLRPCWVTGRSDSGEAWCFVKPPHDAEPEVYELARKLGVRAPGLLGVATVSRQRICVLEDCGRRNLEDLALLPQAPGGGGEGTDALISRSLADLARLHAAWWGARDAAPGLRWRDASFFVKRAARLRFDGCENTPYKADFTPRLGLLGECVSLVCSMLPCMFEGTWALTHADVSLANIAVSAGGTPTLVDWGDCAITSCLLDLTQLATTPGRFAHWYACLTAELARRGVTTGVAPLAAMENAFLTARLYAGLQSCAGRLAGFLERHPWASAAYLDPAAVAAQLMAVEELWETAARRPRRG